MVVYSGVDVISTGRGREGLTIIFQRTYVNSSPLDFSFVIIKIVLTAQREADMMN